MQRWRMSVFRVIRIQSVRGDSNTFHFRMMSEHRHEWSLGGKPQKSKRDEEEYSTAPSHPQKGAKGQASRCLCDFTRSGFNLRQSGSDNCVRLRQPCPLCCLRWALEQVCDFGLIRSSDPTSQMRKPRSKTVGTC